MNYFLDCEFDGFGGPLLSIALVRQDGRQFYAILPHDPALLTPWVQENVVPKLEQVPEGTTIWRPASEADLAGAIHAFLLPDPQPNIVADWPDDIAYFCRALMTGPGMMVAIGRLSFQMLRVRYPEHAFVGRVQHNALHDALVLKDLLD